MKRFGLILAAALCVLVGQAAAQVVVNLGEGEAAEVRTGGGGADRVTWSPYTQMIKVCNLTQEQQDKIKAIEEARNKAAKEFQAANADKVKAAGAAMQEAFKAQDKDAIAQAMKNWQELYAPFNELMKKAHVDVMDVLTPEQKATWQEYTVVNSMKSWFFQAKLTDDQMAKIKAKYGELVKAEGATQESVMKKLSDYVKSDVLTDEQKKAIATPAAERAWITTRPAGGAAGGSNPYTPAPGAAGATGAANPAPGAGESRVIVIEEKK